MVVGYSSSSAKGFILLIYHPQHGCVLFPTKARILVDNGGNAAKFMVSARMVLAEKSRAEGSFLPAGGVTFR
jgi:hypothetical protein